MDTSTPIPELQKFYVEWIVNPGIQLVYNSKCLFDLPLGVLKTPVDWFGDVVDSQLTISGTEFRIKGYCYNSTVLIDIPETLGKHITIDYEVVKDCNCVFTKQNTYYIFHFLQDTTETIIPQKLTLQKLTDFINNLWEKSTTWAKKSPKATRYVKQELWDFLWVLHRMSRHPVKNKTTDHWISKNRFVAEEQPIVPWDLLHIIEDLMWYRPDLASKQLESMFDLWQQPDGMLTNGIKYPDEKTLTFPPVWSFVLLELSKLTGNTAIIQNLYGKCQKNVEWWENHRFNKKYQLFGVKMPAIDLGIESTMFNSPRFLYQMKKGKFEKINPKTERELLLVDLNGQMCDTYQNMGILGMIAGDQDAGHYFRKADVLQSAAHKYLWDPGTKFYYDFDLETDSIQPIKTTAGFWAMYGGIISKAHLPAMIGHLKNPDEFWSDLPIPTVAKDEPMYSKKIWNGPVMLSQNFWLLNGLKRYNLNTIATELSLKIFQYLNNSFELYGGVYKHYPSTSYNIYSIQKKTPCSPKCMGFALGYSPIHSLFYRGLLNAEILDDSINFVPDWSVLNKEIQFSFYYRGKKIQEYLSKMDKKMVDIPSNADYRL